jgi:hypothetical protein
MRGVHLLAAEVARFDEEVRIHRPGNPVQADVAPGMGYLGGDVVGVVIELERAVPAGEEVPALAIVAEVFPGGVADENFDGLGLGHGCNF